MNKPARYLPIPITHDLDRAPQLLTVATAQAALAAVQLALERAHPILAAFRTVRPSHPDLSDPEHLAQIALLSAHELSGRLDDYAAALQSDDDHDDLLPF
jgi:hypothetical protein